MFTQYKTSISNPQDRTHVQMIEKSVYFLIFFFGMHFVLLN